MSRRRARGVDSRARSDTKGGFANINVGIVYTNNASVGGGVHGLYLEFERRVAWGLTTPPPSSERKREGLAVRFFWDQNLFNKVCPHRPRAAGVARARMHSSLPSPRLLWRRPCAAEPPVASLHAMLLSH